MKRIKNQKGFTLIELLVVLVILGILTAIAVTRYQDLTLQAQIGASKGNLATIRGGINLLHARFLLGGYAGTAQEWPSVAELNDNLTAGRTAALNNLRIVEGPAAATCVPASTCMPPNAVMTSNRLVQGVTTAQADARNVSPPAPGAGVGWFYDSSVPSSGQIYIPTTGVSDGTQTANLW